METPRAEARRIFEEALATAMHTYAPVEDLMLEARARNVQGEIVMVARYKVHVDGRIECFEVLDDVLWPNL